MISRILDALLEALMDLVMNPRKGESLIPREDDIEPVRVRVANDLLNVGRGPCECMDCRCGFNKTDPNARPGRGLE